ncbi:MAG: metallophosphoesterase [Spirochaetaceae bacterium]|nr:metallophosphoesterase [Spirochaetaceae bacterium]
MSSQKRQSRLTAQQKSVLIWGLVALLVCAAMNIYFYSLEGARGFYLWYNTRMLRSLILMGLIPIGLALLTFPLEKLKSKLPSRILRWVSIVASAVVTLISVGLLAFLIIAPRSGTIEPAKLNLIDPSKGIIAQATQTQASISSPQWQGATTGQDEQPLLRLSISSDAHWGVSTSNASARTEILQGIAAHNPDAFFLLGDIVENGSQSVSWNQALGDLEALIPRVPIRPVMGNHDALLGGQYAYKKIFFPKGFSSNSGSPYYYSIDAGAAQIIVLDMLWGTEQFGKRQKDWLEKTLQAADPSKPVIVLSHCYYYGSGYDDPTWGQPWYDHYQTIPAVVPLFEKYGVDLVVSGHNHYQEYLEHNGVHYAIIGAMGGISDPPPTYFSPASKWMAVATFGWLDLDVTRTELILSFRNEKGELIHEERIAFRRQ